MSTPDDDGGLCCPAGTPIRRWARQQALDAAVAGAPGWYAVGDRGAVNVQRALAVFACEDPDLAPEEQYRILITDDQSGGWSLNLGPYEYGYEAARVAQQVLILAHDERAWPPAEDLDTGDVDAAADPVLFDV